MFIGVLRLHLTIPGARSLKDKRSVVRSFKERAESRMRVSIAEVGELDHPQHATFGVACVSNAATMCDRILAEVASMAGSLPNALLTDRATEIIPFGHGGSGVQGGLGQGSTSARAMDEDDDDE